MTRYLSHIVFNTQAKKRSQLIKPDKLFPLPQDILLKKGEAKSTPEQLRAFMEQIEKSQSKK